MEIVKIKKFIILISLMTQRPVVGYKVVGSDCRGTNNYLYTVGEVHHHRGIVKLCASGLHYSVDPNDALRYGQDLAFNDKILGPVRFLQVTDLGDHYRDVGKDKTATNVLRVDKELTREEWDLVCMKFRNPSLYIDQKRFDTNCKYVFLAAAGLAGLVAVLSRLCSKK